MPIETYVLCDETLTTTLIYHQTAKCIGLQGTTVGTWNFQKIMKLQSMMNEFDVKIAEHI
jgi:hypothetical protein